MGNLPPGAMGGGDPSGGGTNNADNKDDANKKASKKKRFEPRPHTKRRNKRKGPTGINKTPTILPTSKCKLRLLKLDRIKDFLLLEQEFIANFEGKDKGFV
jgi:26S proteasome regulatory subunit T2